MIKQMDKYFFISREKELEDIEKLAKIIREDDWIDQDTVIVNCSPDYSSIVCMLLNHKLSHLNKNELFYQVKLEMPYPNMIQVWNDVGDIQHFDLYLKEWQKTHLSKSFKYLFVDSGTLRGKNFNKVKL